MNINIENERAHDLGKSQADGSTYFDENESREGGSMIDESTGLPYRNDRGMDSSSPERSVVKKVKEEHIFGNPIGDDDTEKWLRANDPNYEKTKQEWGN